MNSPDICNTTPNHCECTSQTCCKSSLTELLFSSIQNGNIVCNLGTSSGYHIKTVSQYAGATGKIIVISPVPSLLNCVQEEISSFGITNADLRLADIDALPIESNTVDIIAGENSLSTIQSRNSVFKEFHRILRPAGKLVLAEIIGFGVASCLADTDGFDSIKTMLSNDLDECLRLNGFSIDCITISADESFSNSNSGDTASTVALKAIIRALKA